MMRLLILGDLHGRIPELPEEPYDAIIAPGDIIGDSLRSYLKAWIKEAKTHPIDFETYCSVDKQEELEDEAIAQGEKVLSHLNAQGVPVYLVPGNWDPVPLVDGLPSRLRPRSTQKSNRWKTMLKPYTNIHDVMHTTLTCNGLTIIGHGATSEPEILEVDEELAETADNETLKQARHDKKVSKRLHKLFSKTNGPVLLLSHNVPYETPLDIINNPGSPLHEQHYGSLLARELIETYEPLLCVGGHIHEGRGQTSIGPTTCINGGFGSKTYAIVELDTESPRVSSVTFYGENQSWDD